MDGKLEGLIHSIRWYGLTFNKIAFKYLRKKTFFTFWINLDIFFREFRRDYIPLLLIFFKYIFFINLD